MTTDPTPHLLFPSCSDCDRIGLPRMPALIREMERMLGPEVTRTFLLAYGGREYNVRSLPPANEREGHLAIADAWMRETIGFGKVSIPKGPSAQSARLAMTIFTRLCEGWSLSLIAAATGRHTRTVSSRKKLFSDLGLLPGELISNSTNQDPQQ